MDDAVTSILLRFVLAPFNGIAAGWRVLDGLLSGSLNDWSLIRIDYAGDRRVERAVEGGVASFGRQLGIVEEAVRELARGAPGEKMQRLEAMMQAIEWVKEQRLARADPRVDVPTPVRPAFDGRGAE